MSLSIGTFNLKNLFSRFDFTADLSAADPAATALEEQTTFTFSDPRGFKLRKYQGRLVKGKPAAERAKLVERIQRINLDVLAVQEVEDIDTLRAFVRDGLNGLYPHVVLVEGNDPRVIDVGLLSKLPLGGITSWQEVPDPSAHHGARRQRTGDLSQGRLEWTAPPGTTMLGEGGPRVRAAPGDPIVNERVTTTDVALDDPFRQQEAT